MYDFSWSYIFKKIFSGLQREGGLPIHPSLVNMWLRTAERARHLAIRRRETELTKRSREMLYKSRQRERYEVSASARQRHRT